MKKIKTVALHINPSKGSVADAVARTVALLKPHKIRVITADVASSVFSFPEGVESVSENTLIQKTDILIAFGGDGTIISAVRLLKGNPIPVLGINLGGLGFLTATSAKSLDKAINEVLHNRFRISPRVMLEANVVRSSKIVSSVRALNDIVIEHGGSTRMIHLELEVNESKVTSYACDGLIISTPTGSTGHSLSAGGPIVHPKTDAFVISLICPHTLSVRPMVLPDTKTISVNVVKSAASTILSADGQVAINLKPNDIVVVKKSKAMALLVQMLDYNYFAILQEKLHWRGSAIST